MASLVWPGGSEGIVSRGCAREADVGAGSVVCRRARIREYILVKTRLAHHVLYTNSFTIKCLKPISKVDSESLA